MDVHAGPLITNMLIRFYKVSSIVNIQSAIRSRFSGIKTACLRPDAGSLIENT